MKTGGILYVVGGTNPGDDLDMEEAVRSLAVRADRIETDFGRSPHFDVMDAWRRLTAKGMKEIVCMLAEVTNDSELRLTGRELQLCG